MKAIFWIGMVFTLVAPAVIGVYFKDPSTSWVAALCGAFVTFVAKFEEIAELSLGPVKAKMKEQIAEANATLSQLKNVSATISEGFLSELMSGAFFGGMKLRDRFALHDKIIKLLESIGIPEEDIKGTKTFWNKGICVMYKNKIVHIVGLRTRPSTVNTKAPEENNKAADEINAMFDKNTWTAPTPYQIRAVIDKYGVSTPEAEEALADYEYFIATGEIRSRDTVFSKFE